MSDPSDAVLSYWTEHREQLRQSENQRATMTNFILVITAGLSGLVIQQKLATTTLPLSILIVLIGLYGALTAAKYHERAAYHLSQARALTDTLKDMKVLAANANLDRNRQLHYDAYPRLHRVRLHWLWTGLHLAVAVYGSALAVITLAR
jgi:hypothetical protein